MNGETGARGDIDPDPPASGGSDAEAWLVLRLLVGVVTVVALGAALLVGVVHAFVASRLRRPGSSGDGA